MAAKPATFRLIALGSAIAVVLLIAAIWVSDTSTPASLVLTAVVLLAAVGVLGVLAPTRVPDEAADQRERMRRSVP